MEIASDPIQQLRHMASKLQTADKTAADAALPLIVAAHKALTDGRDKAQTAQSLRSQLYKIGVPEDAVGEIATYLSKITVKSLPVERGARE